MRSIKQLDAFSLFVEHEVIRRRNDAVKNVVLLGKFEKFIRGVSLASSFLAPRSIVNLQKYHASRILVRKWFEQHVVDHAENRGRGANP